MENLYFPIKDHGPTLQSQGLMPSFEFSVLDMPLGQQPVPTDEYAEDLEESVQYLDDDVCEECKRKAMRKYRDMTLPDSAKFDPDYAARSAATRRQRGFEEARMRQEEAALLRIERRRPQPTIQPPITQFMAVRGRTRQRKDEPGERYRTRSPGQLAIQEPEQDVPESKEPEGTFINTDPEPMGPPPPRRRRL